VRPLQKTERAKLDALYSTLLVQHELWNGLCPMLRRFLLKKKKKKEPRKEITSDLQTRYLIV